MIQITLILVSVLCFISNISAQNQRFGKFEISETTYKESGKYQNGEIIPTKENETSATSCSSSDFNVLEKETNYDLHRVIGRKNSKAFFYKGEENGKNKYCPTGKNCRRKTYVIAGDEVIVAKTYRGFACAWYPTKYKFGTIGWIKKTRLENQIVSLTKVKTNKWFGTWSWDAENSEGEIIIGPANGSNYLAISGATYYFPVSKKDAEKTGNVNLGTFGDYGEEKEEEAKRIIIKPTGNTITFKPENSDTCTIKAVLIGKFLLVSDKGDCGGLGTSFFGVYRK